MICWCLKSKVVFKMSPHIVYFVICSRVIQSLSIRNGGWLINCIKAIAVEGGVWSVFWGFDCARKYRLDIFLNLTDDTLFISVIGYIAILVELRRWRVLEHSETTWVVIIISWFLSNLCQVVLINLRFLLFVIVPFHWICNGGRYLCRAVSALTDEVTEILLALLV